MEMYLIIANMVMLVGAVLFLSKKNNAPSDNTEIMNIIKQEIQGVKQDVGNNVQNLGNMLNNNLANSNQQSLHSVESLGTQLTNNQNIAVEAQKEQIRNLENQFNTLRNSINEQMNEFRINILAQVGQMEKSITEKQENLRSSVNDQNKELRESVNIQMTDFRKQMQEQAKTMESKMEKLEKTNEVKLEGMSKSIADNMKDMRDDNNKQLEQIRGTVDEKLQTTLEKRISESFMNVTAQLEAVHKGLGEMKNLASDVGGLKKVLGGVKTRGNLGEYQLGAILSEILAPEQYDTNVETVLKSGERVEYAIKLPNENGTVYLPIDSKFPMDTYEQLKDAQESGDRKAVEEAYKKLDSVISSEAKDISDKYIGVPHTTNFAILFLPAEGLYAEVAGRPGLISVLQRKFGVCVAGPSNMAAILNSLQMGFKTLAIQKRSSEVWEVLGAFKKEFASYTKILGEVQKRNNTNMKQIDELIGTRTRAIERKLKNVEVLDSDKANQILELPELDTDAE